MRRTNDSETPIDLGEFNLELSLPYRDAFRREFRSILDRTAPSLSASIPDRLSDSEVFGIDVALTRAWFHNLGSSYIMDGEFCVLQRSTDRRILFLPEGGWGMQTEPSLIPKCGFILHPGVTVTRYGYVTTCLIPVADTAVVTVLEQMFPDGPDGNVPDYVDLIQRGQQW
ncbi:hypothetical protein L209DRAFT_755538 [Thermothelomyces heterothallicus CBS 203.75]